MKRAFSVVLIFSLFFIFQVNVSAASVFRTCSYTSSEKDKKNKTITATLKIFEDGTTDLRVSNKSLQRTIKNTGESEGVYSGTNFNEKGCPTYVVRSGEKYYAYYNKSAADTKKKELGKKAYIFTKETDVISGTNKKTYDSKCTYNFSDNGGSNYSITYYIYGSKFIYGVPGDGSSRYNNIGSGYDTGTGKWLNSQYFKNYSVNSSTECPQLKVCTMNDTMEIYPSSAYICPIDSTEITVNSDGRVYGDDYDGQTVDDNQKITCNTSLKFNDTIGNDLKDEVIQINLSKYANGTRCLGFDGSEECVENNGIPQINKPFKSRSIDISFETNEEADKIFNSFSTNGECSGFNIRQANMNNIVSLTITTKDVDKDESAGSVKPNQSKYEFDQDFDELYDPNWSPEHGCALLQKGTTIDVLRKILNYLDLAAVALLLILGSVDFAGAIMSDKEDAMKQAGDKFKKRLIACVIVFLVPALVNLVLFVANKSESICDLLSGGDSTEIKGDTSDVDDTSTQTAKETAPTSSPDVK